MFTWSREKIKNACNKFFIDESSFQQTIDVMETRAEPLGIEIVIGNSIDYVFDDNFFGCFAQYTSSSGNINDIEELYQVFVFIRMLDCKGYPKAFLDRVNLKYEFSNVKIINNNGISIFIDVKISELETRLKNKKDRPLLNRYPDKGQILKKIYDERKS